MVIKDGFKSLYRSGAGFTAVTLPKYLQKAGIPKLAAAKIAKVIGNAAGIASLLVGAQFLIALPVATPMFFVAAAVMHTKGLLMAAAVASLMAGTGTVVMTAGVGMSRDAGKTLRGLFKFARQRIRKGPAPVPAPPEKTRFDAGATAAVDFKKAVMPEAARPEAAAAASFKPVSAP